MPVIDLSEEQETPTAGPSRLEYTSDSTAARHPRRPRRQPSSEGEIELVSNTIRASSSSPRRNPRRHAQVEAERKERGRPQAEQRENGPQAGSSSQGGQQGMSLSLPSRPDRVFVNLADDPADQNQPARSWVDSDDDEEDSGWGLTRSANNFLRRVMPSSWGSSSSGNNTASSRRSNSSGITVTEEAPLYSSRYARQFSPHSGWSRVGSSSSSTASRGRGGIARGRGGRRTAAVITDEQAVRSVWAAINASGPHTPPVLDANNPTDRWQQIITASFTPGPPHTYASAASSLPAAKYDINESHPRKLARGFRRDVIPPAPVIDLDKTIDPDAESSEEEEEVPVCASCKTELFVPQAEGDKSASRPCAIKCGHIICAACVVLGKKYYRKQQTRKRKANQGVTTNAKSNKKRATTNGVESTAVETETNGDVDPEKHGIVAGLDPGEWIGCPVPTCDGNNTGWLRNLGHPDGLWEIYLNVE